MACWVSQFVVGRANHPVEPGHATMGHILRVWPDRLDISVKLSKLKHLPPQAR